MISITMFMSIDVTSKSNYSNSVKPLHYNIVTNNSLHISLYFSGCGAQHKMINTYNNYKNVF
jgi:hypothetical protein